jgi:hypothetical protein
MCFLYIAFEQQAALPTFGWVLGSHLRKLYRQQYEE